MIGVMVGGPVFTARPELAVLVGADLTAPDADQAVLRAEGLPLRAAFTRMIKAYLNYIIERNAEIVFMAQMANSPYVTAQSRETAALGVRPVADMLERGKSEQLLKDLAVTVGQKDIEALLSYSRSAPLSSCATS